MATMRRIGFNVVVVVVVVRERHVVVAYGEDTDCGRPSTDEEERVTIAEGEDPPVEVVVETWEMVRFKTAWLLLLLWP